VGTIVMGVTGLMLWFEVEVSKWLGLPRWWVDVALLIHFYEAILATLAIIIWHLYAVIFDEVYPVNWAWYDGKMREDNSATSTSSSGRRCSRKNRREVPVTFIERRMQGMPTEIGRRVLPETSSPASVWSSR
jgi:cytochrome b subunit of formate dehydrogenase